MRYSMSDALKADAWALSALNSFEQLGVGSTFL